MPLLATITIDIDPTIIRFEFVRLSWLGFFTAVSALVGIWLAVLLNGTKGRSGGTRPGGTKIDRRWSPTSGWTWSGDCRPESMSDSATLIKTLEPGALLAEQGAAGETLFLLLDGMLSAVVDGVPVAHSRRPYPDRGTTC